MQFSTEQIVLMLWIHPIFRFSRCNADYSQKSIIPSILQSCNTCQVYAKLLIWWFFRWDDIDLCQSMNNNWEKIGCWKAGERMGQPWTKHNNVECSLFVSFFPFLVELYEIVFDGAYIHIFYQFYVTSSELIDIFMAISNMHLQNRLRYAVDAF